jgi:hypothetical protein
LFFGFPFLPLPVSLPSGRPVQGGLRAASGAGLGDFVLAGFRPKIGQFPDRGEGVPTISAPVGGLAQEVISSLRTEILSLITSKDEAARTQTQDINDLKATQTITGLLAKATALHIERARAQFVAFAKIKSGVAEACCLLESHDTEKALDVLAGVEKVADVRIDVVRQADSTRGDSDADFIYIVQGEDQQQSRFLWGQSLEKGNQGGREQDVQVDQTCQEWILHFSVCFQDALLW